MRMQGRFVLWGGVVALVIALGLAVGCTTQQTAAPAGAGPEHAAPPTGLRLDCMDRCTKSGFKEADCRNMCSAPK